MLKQRLLTALILIPLVVWAVLGLSTAVLGLILGLFVLLGSWEWARLIGLQSTLARSSYVAFIAMLLYLSTFLLATSEGFVFAVLVVAGLWWLVGTAWVFRYRGETGLKPADTQFGLFIGVVVLIPTWLAMTYIHAFSDDGPAMLLFVMVLIWAADSGAYFAGRKFGKHKLAPRVSPGKTIEGVVGGLFAAALFSVIGAASFDLPVLGGISFVLLSVVVVLLSVIGDLFESLFKRRAGVKDSGQLLPGHGGVLDRIDSLTAAAPIFALALALFEAAS
ncbi:MAG TPA: phosphatidate cytidylyltransferase [Candidatus Tenderia electrophaga]|uniref:Phosphatidate cytidylyltransferase n=1 Tax=Candidatus Tenderia electrophaga TaxID=1748243 RepID=A0A832J350_9GAMM|nr:phosphatidate cytidylyltransferase [Candidatus Tenderia electrophaga]